MYKIQISTLKEMYLLLSAYERDVLKSNKTNKRKLNRIAKLKNQISFVNGK